MKHGVPPRSRVSQHARTLHPLAHARRRPIPLDATRSGVSCLLRPGRLSGTREKRPRKTKLVPKARRLKRISAPN